jgi:predicted DNA binding CopG/RHH family protein
MTRKLIYGEPVEMSEEESAHYTALEEQAERDAAREISEQRVNLRWSREQVDLIRKAAAVFGITYQTYLKQAAVRQALADLKVASEVASTLGGTASPSSQA